MAGLFKKLFNRGQENEQEELQTEEPEQLTDEEIEAILEEEIENEETEGLKQAEEEETEEEASFFSRLKNGLAKTRRNIAGKLNGVLASFKSVDEEL